MMSNRHGGDKHHNGGNVSPPSVPAVQRGRNPSQKIDDAIASTDYTNHQQQHGATTDEFGFPITSIQQLRSSSPPHLHVENIVMTSTQTVDLESVQRPSRVAMKKQHRGQSAKSMQNNNNSSSSTSLQKLQRVSSKNSISATTSNTSNNRPPHSYVRQNSHPSTITAPAKQKKNKKPPPRIKISKPKPSTYNKYTFQHPVNASRCTIRTIDISNRVAFDTHIPSSCNSASLQYMVDRMNKARPTTTVGSSSIIDEDNTTNAASAKKKERKKKRSDNPCKISPSPNHMALLEFMHGGGTNSSKKRIVRQLQWNAACSVDADPWFDGHYCNEEEADDTSAAMHRERRRRRRPKSIHGDGRYIPIDPIATTKSMIPNHSTILTNMKRRLPMRSDVGFANPKPEEIALKMDEIKKEAEWEESSPRIVLLASAFSLFQDSDEEEMDKLHPSCISDVKLWVGGMINGIPFAGRDLVTAYNNNTVLMMNGKKDCNEKKAKKQITNISKDIEQCRNPRSYSVFAPPVDATFSSSLIWRPKLFMDRPPGIVYFLACPLDVQLEKMGDVDQPLFCTMALYCLPDADTLQQQNGNELGKFSGKISEDFFFLAGNWNNEIEQEDGSQSWCRKRKRRAVMSFDPLEVSPNDLHLVIQLYKAKRPCEGDSGNQTKKSFGGKIKRGLLSKGKSRDGETTKHVQSGICSFEEVGSQYLIPVCFSITPVFDTDENQDKHERASFFSFPDMPQSHEDFIGMLSSLAANTHHNSYDRMTKPTSISGYIDLFTSYLGNDFTRALLNTPPQLLNAVDDTASSGPQLLADVMGDCAISFDEPSLAQNDDKKRSNLRRLPPQCKSGYSTSFDIKEVLYFPPRSLPRKYEDETALCSSTIINLLYIYPRLIRLKKNDNTQKSGGEYLTIRVQIVEQDLPSDQQSFDSTEHTYQSLPAIYNPSSHAGPPLIASYFTKLVERRQQTDDNNKHDVKTKSDRKDIPLKDEVKARLPAVLDRRHFLQFSLFSIRRDGTDVDLLAETTIPFIISSKESTSGGRVTTIIPNGLHRIQLSDGIQIRVETRLASTFHISDPSVATLLRDYPIVLSSANSTVNSNGSAASDMDSASSASDAIAVASSGFPLLDILTMASGQAVKLYFSCLITANMRNFVNLNCPSFGFESFGGMLSSNGDVTFHQLVPWEKTDALVAIIRSLFEILDKTRTSYQTKNHSILSLQYQRLVKSLLDTFDEHLFLSNISDDERQHSENGGSIHDNHLNELLESNLAFNHDDDHDHDDEHPSLLNESKGSQKRMPKYRVTSPKSSMDPKFFSRTAFVATEDDQSKTETKMNGDDAYGREYFDDDQTIATLGTMMTSTSRLNSSSSVFPIIMETKSFNTVGGPPDESHLLQSKHSNTVGGLDEQPQMLQSQNSTVEIQKDVSRNWTCGATNIASTALPKRRSAPPKRFSASVSSSSTPFSFAAKRAEQMANRVNTMAQLVMAPCIAPSVDETISRSSENDSPRQSIRVTSQSSLAANNQSPYEPSSDVEEEGTKNNNPPYLRGNQSCLKIPPIAFTPMRQHDDSSMNGHMPRSFNTPHVYEVIFSLWVQSWTSFASSINSTAHIYGSSDTISTWPYELVQGSHHPTSDAIVAFSFIRNMSFFLPFCLKSIGLRCAQYNTTKLNVTMTFLE